MPEKSYLERLYEEDAAPIPEEKAPEKPTYLASLYEADKPAEPTPAGPPPHGFMGDMKAYPTPDQMQTLLRAGPEDIEGARAEVQFEQRHARFLDVITRIQQASSEQGGQPFSMAALGALYPRDEADLARLEGYAKAFEKGRENYTRGLTGVEKGALDAFSGFEKTANAFGTGLKGIVQPIARGASDVVFGDPDVADPYQNTDPYATTLERNLPPGFIQQLDEDVKANPTIELGSRLVQLAVALSPRRQAAD